MSIPPNGRNVKRKYDSPRRRAQAARTRRDIVEAARVLFEARGYAGTTLAAIASQAGVAVETIYRSFGGKAPLLEEAIRVAVAGGFDRAEVPIMERPAVRAIMEEGDARKKIALHSATQPGIHTRSGPILRALREAAGSDEDLEQVYERVEGQRLDGMARYAEDLLATGQTRAGLSTDRMRDVIWTLTSLDVYDRLVLGRGWSPDAYVEWLTESLARLLLEP